MGNPIFSRGLASVGMLVVLAGGLITGDPCWGFHDGGTAPCDGCHTMHNVRGGMKTSPNAYLLQAASPSSLCLNCHEGQLPYQHFVSTSGALLVDGFPPNMMTPGGDFAWLKKTYTWTSGSIIKREAGDRHGHNIVATDYGYASDATLAVAPGGSYPAQRLHCTSCHDPHGRYRVLADGTVGTTGIPIEGSGSISAGGVARNPVAGRSGVGTYRLLAGVGYQPPFLTGQAFTANPPAAMAPASYNRAESTAQTRVAYGSNVSEWCGNCHLTGGSGSLFHHQYGHTTQNLAGVISDNYNRYVKTGDLSGTSNSSFTSLVPFQMELTNAPRDRNSMAAVACSDGSCLTGPGTQETISCLTCHRAHASGWRAIMRWNPDAALIVCGGVYPGIGTGSPPEYNMGRTESETRRAYYDRPASVFALNQNRLCEKCHPDGPLN